MIGTNMEEDRQRDLDKDERKIALRNNNADVFQSWIANEYIRAATSENTRKAYRCDIQHFDAWGGGLPATAQQIVQYLQYYASILNPRTLARRLTALKHWHIYQGFDDPTQHPSVRKTLIGVLRVHGKPKIRAYPLLVEDLLLIVQKLNSEQSMSSYRDNALLQVGYFGALRRSELSKLCVDQLVWEQEGIEMTIVGSKTDPENQGQYSALPYGNGLLCPVTALKEWLELAKLDSGPIFREIKKGEIIQNNAISAASVNLIIKKRARECGLSFANRLSGHSLRRGLATSASQSGANLLAIMRQGRWKRVETVMEYIESRDRFSENVGTKIIKSIKTI